MMIGNALIKCNNVAHEKFNNHGDKNDRRHSQNRLHKNNAIARLLVIMAFNCKYTVTMFTVMTVYNSRGAGT